MWPHNPNYDKGLLNRIHSFISSYQLISCPRLWSPSKVPCSTILVMWLWWVTCPNHATLLLSKITQKFSCGPALDVIWSQMKSSVLRSFQKILSTKAYMLWRFLHYVFHFNVNMLIKCICRPCLLQARIHLPRIFYSPRRPCIPNHSPPDILLPVLINTESNEASRMKCLT